MHPLPECILRYWHDWLTDQLTYGYALTDHKGYVSSAGGDL